MELFIQVLTKFKIHPVTVFAEAFDYYEVRLTKDALNELFSSCCIHTDGSATLAKIPTGVHLYCAELLCGIATPTYRNPNLPEMEVYEGEVKGE